MTMISGQIVEYCFTRIMSFHDIFHTEGYRLCIHFTAILKQPCIYCWTQNINIKPFIPFQRPLFDNPRVKSFFWSHLSMYPSAINNITYLSKPVIFVSASSLWLLVSTTYGRSRTADSFRTGPGQSHPESPPSPPAYTHNVMRT